MWAIGPPWMGWMWVFPVIFLIIMLVLAGRVGWPMCMGRREHRDARADNASPRDVLDARYAKGDLTREEYLQMKSDLEGPSRPA
jgi:putative membrane protein